MKIVLIILLVLAAVSLGGTSNRTPGSRSTGGGSDE